MDILSSQLVKNLKELLIQLGFSLKKSTKKSVLYVKEVDNLIFAVEVLKAFELINTDVVISFNLYGKDFITFDLKLQKKLLEQTFDKVSNFKDSDESMIVAFTEDSTKLLLNKITNLTDIVKLYVKNELQNHFFFYDEKDLVFSLALRCAYNNLFDDAKYFLNRCTEFLTNNLKRDLILKKYIQLLIDNIDNKSLTNELLNKIRKDFETELKD